MLTYPLNEARALLHSKQNTASTSVQHAIEDLDWLREQITVTEVNIARVYNWDVKSRRTAQ